ncbi:DUF1707 SHOCT-like domain-containing protein [Nocardia aurantiaca]|uniref:DUF1707 domain-containing protein n=1 Tax=Nocardia aurantiaca TaxID=2675850 RepID=A0A6I3KUL9_9NOCA|nr:DUF1707 domain-containing protein [Nocardia aurantiaca]MTE11754.1 DUF1707 domain-containing protein [Nocardia aurantiaca]
MAEPPEIRIGTVEREDAMKRLSDHFAAGRLSVAEFDERSGIVAAALTRGDIDKVFTDLPEPVAEKSVPAQREFAVRPSHGPRRVMAVIPILAVILFFVTHQWWVFLLIPLAGAVLFGEGKRERQRLDRRDRRRQRRLDRGRED